MAHPLNGTWILESSENFDSFMKELGVGFVLRKAGNMVVPTLIISNEGNKWSIKMRSTFKNNDDEFVIDQEFDDETTDGRKVKAIFHVDGGKLSFEQKDRKTGEVQVTGWREVNAEGKMIETLKCKSVTAIRTFKRVEN